MTDRAGNIWTGYGDEASIYAQHLINTPMGWTPRPHRMTVFNPGLVRWTAAGEPDWYAAFDPSCPSRWFDCYALNVGAHRTWAYPYSGFPLVEIDQRGIRCVRRTPVCSASGVIVADHDVAFIARDGDHPQTPGHYTVTFARSDDGPVEATTTAPLLMPDGNRPGTSAPREVCRDNQMWMQFADPHTWYVIEI
jgi:hypothetical protein